VLKVLIDDRIRLASSILASITGNSEIEEWAHPHPLRLATQKFLEPFRSHPCTLMFSEICKRIPQGTPPGSLLYLAALLLKGPPEFAWDVDEPKTEGILLGMSESYGAWIHDEPYRTIANQMMALIREVSDSLPNLLADFYETTKIGEFWIRHHGWGEGAVRQCSTLMEQGQMVQWLHDFYGENGDLVLVPNSIDPPTDAFGFVRRSSKYAVIGPPAVTKQMEDSDANHQYERNPQYVMNTAFHEFSHGLVKKYLNSGIIKRTEGLDRRNSYRGWFASAYPIWPLQCEEIFIRATTALFLSQLKGESVAEGFLEGEREQHGIYAIDEFYKGMWDYVEGKRKGRYTDLAFFLDNWAPTSP